MKPLSPDTKLQDRYKITEMIGKGGMGEVYLAIDQRLGHSVALKRTTVGDDHLLTEAFEREARTLAQLRHGVLPKVSDHFIENDEQFLVMDYISGEDLSERIKATNKAFPINWVMFWADQLLDALTYLHTHTPPIIHRDIKPQNLKLTSENHIVLLDFGLSKNTQEKTQMTTSGSVIGYTPHYASMEQIRGTGTNPKSDLFSLSATLYQLATNVIPPDALTRADAMLSGSNDPIRPLTEFNTEMTEKISDAILKGMEISQEKRFATARGMQKTLRRAYNELQKSLSAKTLAFNANDVGVENVAETPVGDETAIMALLPVKTEEIPPSEISNGLAIEQTKPQENLEPTLVGGYRPDDLAEAKTEIFDASELDGISKSDSTSDDLEDSQQIADYPTDDSVAMETEEIPNVQVPTAEPIENLPTQEEIPTVIRTNPAITANEDVLANSEIPTNTFESNKAESGNLELDNPSDSNDELNQDEDTALSAGLGLTNNFQDDQIQEIEAEETFDNSQIASSAIASSAVVDDTDVSQKPLKEKSSVGKYIAIIGGLGVVLVILLGTALAVGLYYTNGNFGFGGGDNQTETETDIKPEAVPSETPNTDVADTENSESDVTQNESENSDANADSETTDDESDSADSSDETKPTVTQSDQTTTKKTTTARTKTTKKPPVKTTRKSTKTTRKPPVKTTKKPPVKKKKVKDAGVL